VDTTQTGSAKAGHGSEWQSVAVDIYTDRLVGTDGAAVQPCAINGRDGAQDREECTKGA
jgi:hypothetical protein